MVRDIKTDSGILKYQDTKTDSGHLKFPFSKNYHKTLLKVTQIRLFNVITRLFGFLLCDIAIFITELHRDSNLIICVATLRPYFFSLSSLPIQFLPNRFDLRDWNSLCSFSKLIHLIQYNVHVYCVVVLSSDRFLVLGFMIKWQIYNKKLYNVGSWIFKNR